MKRIVVALAAVSALLFTTACEGTAAGGEIVDYKEVHTPNGDVPCVVTSHGVSCGWDTLSR